MLKLLKTLGKATFGETLKEEQTITFPSVEKLFKILTPARWEIVKALQTREFKSIRDLAKFLGRDYSNVWEDIQILNDLGIVEVEKTERGYRVVYSLRKDCCGISQNRGGLKFVFLFWSLFILLRFIQCIN